MHIHVCTKQKCAHACQCAYQNVHKHIYALCAHVITWNFTKLVLVVHYYAMTLSLKFHKDRSFCCGDMRKIVLNMHAIGINANATFQYTHVHVFVSCAHVFAQIFTKNFLGVHYSVISLSFKFHKDLMSRSWDKGLLYGSGRLGLAWLLLKFRDQLMLIQKKIKNLTPKFQYWTKNCMRMVHLGILKILLVVFNIFLVTNAHCLFPPMMTNVIF